MRRINRQIRWPIWCVEIRHQSSLTNLAWTVEDEPEPDAKPMPNPVEAYGVADKPPAVTLPTVCCWLLFVEVSRTKDDPVAVLNTLADNCVGLFFMPYA